MDRSFLVLFFAVLVLAVKAYTYFLDRKKKKLDDKLADPELSEEEKFRALSEYTKAVRPQKKPRKKPLPKYPTAPLSEEGKTLLASARAGEIAAIRRVADHYLSDDNSLLPYNPKESLKWHKKWAKKGDPEGMYELAILYYYNEHAIPENHGKATKLLEQAIKLGHKEAEELLEEMKNRS